jgi:hypothetical protein
MEVSAGMATMRGNEQSKQRVDDFCVYFEEERRTD